MLILTKVNVIAVIFINVKTQKQYRRHSVDVWINKLWYYLLLVNLMLVVKEFGDKQRGYSSK